MNSFFFKILFITGFSFFSFSTFAQYKGGEGGGYSGATAMVTSTTENIKKDEVILSPNPVLSSGIVGFKYEGANPPERIVIYTLNKQTVKQIIPETLAKWTFFTAPNYKGAYIVEFNYGNYKTYSKLIVTN